jgi:hypothetical protein
MPRRTEDLEIYIAVVGDVNLVARVVPDFLWDDRLQDTDVLVVGHGGAKEIVLDVEAKVAGTVFGIRDGAVYMNFYV